MTTIKDKRAQIVWVLLTCILLNAFVCCLNHAQHAGFELAIGEAARCGNEGSAGLGALPADTHDLLQQSLDCPLCGSVFVALVAMAVVAWLGRTTAGSPRRPRLVPSGTRHHWPALNPHAP